MNQIKPSTYQVGNRSQSSVHVDGKKTYEFLLKDFFDELLRKFDLINCNLCPFLREATEGEEDKKSLSSMTADYFKISTHTLKIKNSGAFIDIDEIWSQHGDILLNYIFHNIK